MYRAKPLEASQNRPHNATINADRLRYYHTTSVTNKQSFWRRITSLRTRVLELAMPFPEMAEKSVLSIAESCTASRNRANKGHSVDWQVRSLFVPLEIRPRSVGFPTSWKGTAVLSSMLLAFVLTAFR